MALIYEIGILIKSDIEQPDENFESQMIWEYL